MAKLLGHEITTTAELEKHADAVMAEIGVLHSKLSTEVTRLEKKVADARLFSLACLAVAVASVLLYLVR